MDRYAVVGNPVAHSKSPQIHEVFARETGQDMSYERLLAPLGGFVATTRRFVAEGGKGLNVTVPFKLEAYAMASARSVRAEEARACNTLVWRDDAWYAENTDGVGLLRDLTDNLDQPLSQRDVLVLGAGGAARGIMGPLLARAPRSVALLNRTASRAEELAAEFSRQGPVASMSSAQLDGRRFDVVINATSVGISGDVSGGIPARLWPALPFAPGGLAYDLVYSDSATPFLGWAREQGAARTADGLGMLIEQAAESFALWRGVRPRTNTVFAMLRPGR